MAVSASSVSFVPGCLCLFHSEMAVSFFIHGIKCASFCALVIHLTLNSLSFSMILFGKHVLFSIF